MNYYKDAVETLQEVGYHLDQSRPFNFHKSLKEKLIELGYDEDFAESCCNFTTQISGPFTVEDARNLGRIWGNQVDIIAQQLYDLGFSSDYVIRFIQIIPIRLEQ